MPIVTSYPFGRSGHDEVCQYGDCQAYATGGIRMSLCEAHARMAFEDGLAMDLMPTHLADVSEREAGVGSVYLVRFGDRVKVGFSRNPEQRLKHVPHDEVLAIVPNVTMRVEKALHLKLAAHRITGEWFEDCPAVRQAVAAVAAA